MLTHRIVNDTTVEGFDQGRLFLRRQCDSRDAALRFSGHMVNCGSTWADRRTVDRGEPDRRQVQR